MPRKKIFYLIRSHTVGRLQINKSVANGHALKKLITNQDGTVFGFECKCTPTLKTIHTIKKNGKIEY